MAKKDDDFNFDIDNDDGLDFDDFNLDDDPFSPKSRTPAQTAAKYAMVFGKSSTSSAGKKIFEEISREMPEASSLFFDAVNIKNEVKEIAGESLTKISEIGTDLKKTVRPFLPYGKKLLPQKVYQWLDDALKAEEKNDDDRKKSIEGERSEFINSQITTLFTKQAKTKKAEVAEDRSNRTFDLALGMKHHKEDVVSNLKIRHELQAQNEFLNSQTLNYYKKSLELKYRHLFVAQDNLEVSKATSKMLADQLPKLTHNTALPDLVKSLKSEELKHVWKQKAYESLSEGIKNFASNAIQGVRKNLKGKLDDTHEAIKEMGDMTGGIDEDMMEEMSDPYLDVVSMISGAIGGKFGGPVAKRLKSFLGPNMQRGEEKSKNYKTKAYRKLLEKKDDWGMNYGSGWDMFNDVLNEVLPTKVKTIDYDKTDLIKNPLKPSQWAISDHQALTEIIPGYLAKILKQSTDLATGKNNEEVFYNYQSQNFDNRSVLAEQVRKRSFNDKDQAVKVASKIGMMKGMYNVNFDDTVPFEEQIANLKTFIFNMNTENKLLKIDDIQKFSTDPSYSSDFIRTVFKDIENPQALAKLIMDMISSGGEIDKFKVDQFENYVIEAGNTETHLNKIRSALSTPGYARLLDDEGVFENRTSAKSKINEAWISKNLKNNKISDLTESKNIASYKANHLSKRKTYEEAILLQKLNDPDYIVGDEDREEIKRLLSLENKATTESYNIPYDATEEFKVKKRYNDDTFGGSSPKSVKGIGSLTTVTKGIQSTVDKIFEFMTKEKTISDNNTNNPSFTDIILEKIDFINENIFLASETIEKGFSKLATTSSSNYSSVNEEIRDLLKIHATKSNDDRTKMLEYLAELTLFNYHEGDPVRAAKILSRTQSFFKSDTFKSLKSAGSQFATGSWDLLKQAGKVVNPLNIGKKIKKIYQDVRRTDANPNPSMMSDLYNMGIGMTKLSIAGISLPFKIAAYPFKLMNKFKKGSFNSRFKQGRTKHDKPSGKLPIFFDVYKQGTNTVILFREIQEDGVLLINGSPLEKTVDISQPVISKTQPPNILVSQKDIDEGLCDANGTPLSELAQQYYQEEQKKDGFDFGKLKDKLGKGASSLWKGISGAAKGGAGVFGAFATPLNMLALQSLGMLGKGISGAAKGIHSTLFGKKESDERVLKRLDIIIDIMGGTPPEDYEKGEKKEGLFSKLKGGISSMFSNIKNSKFVQDEGGFVDMSLLNKLKRKKKPLDENKFDMLKNEDLDDLKSFYSDQFGNSEDDTSPEEALLTQSNSFLSKILKAITKLVTIEEKESKFSDRDGDGENDKKLFGWGKIKSKIKNKKESKASGKDGKHGVGATVAGAALGNKKPGDDEDEGGGFFSGLFQMALGNILGDTLMKGGLKNLLSKQGLKSLFSGVGNLVKTAIPSLIGGLGTAVGAASTGAVALTVGTGAAIGTAGGLTINHFAQKYGGTKNFGATMMNERKKKYALLVNGKVNAVKDFFAGSTRDWITDLEKECLSMAQKQQPIKLSDDVKMEFIRNLGWDINDDSLAYFNTWFSGRFAPVFQIYIDMLKSIDLDYYSANNIDMKDEKAGLLQRAVQGIKVPDEKIQLADFQIKAMMNKNKEWIDPVTGEKRKGLRPSNEVMDYQRNEMMDKKASTLGGEEAKSWWQKSPVQFIKDKLAEKELDKVEYDPKYKFDGDEKVLFEKTKAWIKGHEGLRLKPYNDSRGFNTIGYGHLNTENYQDIDKLTADKLFDKDVDYALSEANKLPEFGKLDPVRRMAMVDLIYNMGRGKFSNFVKTRQLLAEGKYPEASQELLKSDYAGQVGDRAKEVAALIKSGDPNNMRPKAISTSWSDKNKISAEDLNLLSNKQFNSDIPKKSEAAPNSSSLGTTNETGGKTPTVPTNSVTGQIPKIPTVETPVGDKSSFTSEPGKNWILEKKSNVNMSGLNPQVRQNFEMMAAEYKAETGKPILVTSAYRDIAKQAELYKTDPSQAAPPGRSLHNFGYALDIDKKDAGYLDTKDYLEKYGFHRPLLSKNEPWHIQPINVDKKTVMAQKKQGEESDPQKTSSASKNIMSTGGIAGQAEQFRNEQKVSTASSNTQTDYAKTKTVAATPEVKTTQTPIAPIKPEINPIDQMQKSLANIKIDTTNDKTFSELAKTNQLLTEIKNIFGPIAEMMKASVQGNQMKTATANVGNTVSNKPSFSSTSPVVDVRKKG